MMRQCGDCTLCCKLVPVKAIEKPAGVKCPHVRWGKGCTIYADRPRSCREWTCAWRLGADTADLQRPDRSHCVIDELGSCIYQTHQDTGERTKFPAVQIWCDPAHPHAYLHPTILAFMRRRGATGLGAIIRYGREEGLVIIPPTLSASKNWIRYHPAGMALGGLNGCVDVPQAADVVNDELPEETFAFGMPAALGGFQK